MFGLFKKMQPGVQPASAVADNSTPLYLDAWPYQRHGQCGLDDGVLRLRVAEAVAWCDSLTSPTDLWSEALRPGLFHDGPDDVVRDLGHRRQQKLHGRKLQVRYESPVVATGRFMLYFPDDSLSDGYAELVSAGFFDADNLPAYDTWVSFISEDNHPGQSARRYLLCYVPTSFVDAADAGIEGNPESCIVWLEQSDASVRPRVEALTSLAPHKANVA